MEDIKFWQAPYMTFIQFLSISLSQLSIGIKFRQREKLLEAAQSMH